MVIAIDFDGTCTTHEFPNVGKEIGAVPVLKRLVDAGHKLILFTMRSFSAGTSPVTNDFQSGGLLDAINWFKENDIELFGVQMEPTQANWTSSPKCYAHLYIDDAALGIPLRNNLVVSSRPYVDWKAVDIMLKEKGLYV